MPNNRFPSEAVLCDGKKLLVRPFTRDDADRLWLFFQRLPSDTRRFAWDDLSDRGLVDGWGRNVDYSKVLPLVALDGQRLVADATIHFHDRGPLRLTGRIKWLIDPEFRSRGLGTILINHFISIGRANGLRHLMTLLITDLEAEAIKTLKGLGFASFPIPSLGTDPDGNQHDMTMMVMRL